MQPQRVTHCTYTILPFKLKYVLQLHILMKKVKYPTRDRKKRLVNVVCLQRCWERNRVFNAVSRIGRREKRRRKNFPLLDESQGTRDENDRNHISETAKKKTDDEIRARLLHSLRLASLCFILLCWTRVASPGVFPQDHSRVNSPYTCLFVSARSGRPSELAA